MEAFKFQKLGVIPYERKPEDLRVGSAEPATPQLPYEDAAFFDPGTILMQGFSPECGGYSLAFLLAYLSNLTDKLNGTFAYAFEKTVDGVPNADGTTIQAIGTAAKSSGVCLESLFPDDSSNPSGAATTPFTKASPAAIEDAWLRAGWIPLFLTDLSWNGIQAAIAKYKAVILEAEVGDEWYMAQNGNVSWAEADVLPIRPPKQVIDAHFFVAGGKFDSQDIWFANSWSEEWGHNGFGYFQENYIPFVRNAIVLYKAPPSIQTVQNHPTLSQPEKLSIIQQIIDDIAKEVGLISQEMGQL
jgi:hypothetical protein